MRHRELQPPRDYTCPKCRGRQPHVREVTISKAGSIPFLASRDNRYIEVTCSLCGYTEFYNLAIYAASREEALKTAKIPLPEGPKNV